MSRWWSNLGRGQRVGAIVVALVVGINLTFAGLSGLIGGGDPGGPISSSFSTGEAGLEAFADLARGAGHPVSRLKGTLTDTDLPAGATAVVADPEQLTGPEAQLLASFTRRGGRLVLVGRSSEPLVAAVSGVAVEWQHEAEAQRITVWLAADGVGSARSVEGSRGGFWRTTGPLLPVAGSGTRPVLLAAPVGRGRMLALADAGPLQNQNLGRADNAALALGLLGDGGRPVVFVESVHGFSGGGLSAIPPSWKWTAAGVILALVLGLWGAGSRFGPPEPQRRELRPPRLDHVEAIAADLDRVTTDSTQAAAPLAAATRAAMAERIGAAPDASPDVLRRGAGQAGLDPRDVELLVSPPRDPAAALAIGALAASRQRAALGMTEPLPGTVPTEPDSRGANP